MPFNGSGTFVGLAPPNFPAVPGTVILASQFNNNMNDIFTTGLTNCMTRDGQSPPSNNIPMAGFRLTGLGAATALTDAPQLQQTLATRGQVGAVDWNTQIVNGIFEAVASNLTGPASNFPPTSALGFLYVTASGALINQMYITGNLIYCRQKLAGNWSLWALQSNANPNAIINGNFDLWSYATSQSTSGYGSADRWNMQNVGSTKVTSRVTATVGFNGNGAQPRYLCATVVTSVANAANCVLMSQRIEYVNTFEGQSITVGFWAQCDASRPIAVNVTQNFGTGGSPSAAVIIAGQKITITTTPTFYSLTFVIPSTTGKTLGSNNNDFLEIAFWFDAGANFNTQTNSLGQQSGTFTIWSVKAEQGETYTGWVPKSLATEQSDCSRFFNVCAYRMTGQVTNTFTHSCDVWYPNLMRATPTIVDNNTANVNFPASPTTFNENFLAGCHPTRTANGTGNGAFTGILTASAEL